MILTGYYYTLHLLIQKAWTECLLPSYNLKTLVGTRTVLLEIRAFLPTVMTDYKKIWSHQYKILWHKLLFVHQRPVLFHRGNNEGQQGYLQGYERSKLFSGKFTLKNSMKLKTPRFPFSSSCHST